MFQGIPTDDPDDQLKLGEVSVSLAVIAVGVESSLIMFPINITIAQIFDRVKVKPTEMMILPRLVLEENKKKRKHFETSEKQERDKSGREKEVVVYEDEDEDDEDFTQSGKW